MGGSGLRDCTDDVMNDILDVHFAWDALEALVRTIVRFDDITDELDKYATNA